MRVGVGKIIITPPKSMWLAGYAHRDHPSEGGLHDLHVKTVCFEDETNQRFIWVTADLLGFPREVSQRISAELERRFSIPRERLLLVASHTHSGPVLEAGLIDMYGLDEEQLKLVSEYTDWLIERVVESAALAIGDLSPCRLYWGIGCAEFATNRREYTLDGIINGYNPIGPVDHDVPLLRIDRMDGTLKAVVFGYACHNTVLDLHQFSGDFAGFAQLEIEERASGAVALFVPGCAGDQNPYPRRSVELAKAHGHALARSVFERIHRNLTEVEGPIQASFQEIPLAFEYPSVRKSLEDQLHGHDEFLRDLANRLLETMRAEEKRPADYPYPIQVWRFSDTLQITALGGEPVVDYSLRLKHELGRANHWVLGYANDVMAYIPSRRVLNEGGYEGDVSMVYHGFPGVWNAEIEQRILGTVHRTTGALAEATRPRSK